MPSLQQTSNFRDCNLASDILQKHSINSLLEQSDDLILPRSSLSSPTEAVDANLSFIDLFNNMGTSTPKGFSSPDSAYTQNTPSKMFDNFQFDNRIPRHLSFDCNVTTPASPSTPGSSKAYMNSSSSPYGNDSGFSYNNSISRSDSPMINESQDLSSPNLEARSLADIMSLFSISQMPQHHQQQRQVQSDHHAEFKAMQAYQMLQQHQYQLNLAAAAAAAQPLLQTQFLNRYNQERTTNNNNSTNGQSWRQPPPQQQLNNAQPNALDHAAKYHRSSAALYDPSCTWSGVLPPRAHRFITYSPKVFLGGIPWDISEQTLMQIFKPFGQIKIEWPGKEQNAAQPKGYVYVIFESEKQVKALLQACNIQDNFASPSAHSHYDGAAGDFMNEHNNSPLFGNTNGNYYYKISSKRIKEKEVEVIPWIIGDSNYIKSANQKLESTKTVFVGALHGKLTAEGLARIMNDLFDGVIYAGIDTDKYKYPIGSGRVTFNNTRSYMRAVAAAFIEIKTSKFTKKVQIDPYLEDSLCSLCGVQHGPYYCRELSCFRYFCRQCWQMRHNNDAHLRNHKPLTRNSKTQQQIHANHGNHSSIFCGSLGSGSSGSSSMASNPGSPNESVSSILNFQMK